MLLLLYYRKSLSLCFQLRDYYYVNRVKSLSKSGNAKKDQGVSSLPPVNKESSSAASLPTSVDVEDVYEPQLEVKLADMGRRMPDKESSYNHAADFDRQPSSFSSNYPFNAREESGVAPGLVDRERVEMKNSFVGSTSQKMYSSSYSQNSVDTEEKVQKVSPPRRKVPREEKLEKLGNWQKKESGTDMPFTSSKQQNTSNSNVNNVASRQYEPEPPNDGSINAILEVC